MASFLVVIRICSNSFFPTFLMNFEIGGQIIGMRIDWIDRFLPVARGRFLRTVDIQVSKLAGLFQNRGCPCSYGPL